MVSIMGSQPIYQHNNLTAVVTVYYNNVSPYMIHTWHMLFIIMLHISDEMINERLNKVNLTWSLACTLILLF